MFADSLQLIDTRAGESSGAVCLGVLLGFSEAQKKGYSRAKSAPPANRTRGSSKLQTARALWQRRILPLNQRRVFMHFVSFLLPCIRETRPSSAGWLLYCPRDIEAPTSLFIAEHLHPSSFYFAHNMAPRRRCAECGKGFGTKQKGHTHQHRCRAARGNRHGNCAALPVQTSHNAHD